MSRPIRYAVVAVVCWGVLGRAAVGGVVAVKIYWRIYRGPRKRIKSKIFCHTYSGMRGKHHESCYMQWRVVEKRRGEPSSRMWDFIEHGS